MRILDLFCGIGGAAYGYHQAGFEVVGVDIKYQPGYLFEHHVADALTFPLEGYDAIHASPPCQAYSLARNFHADRQYPDLVGSVRERLQNTGLPYVIENVPGAPLHDPVVLCGAMFDLGVIRHRLFEVNFPLQAPVHPEHDKSKKYVTVAGHHKDTWGAREAMGITWSVMQRELTQAIPPAYTKWIGTQLRTHLVNSTPI